MFTNIDLDLVVVVAGVPLLLILQRQPRGVRWALCGDTAPIWTGWAGLA